jgi:glycosyltransferase involved in cell wall biosynthesis
MNETLTKSNSETITIIINTHNEENNIKECIESAKLLSDNILVVDMESKDKTVQIANDMGAEVISFPHSNYVEPGRQFSINQAKNDWVFILDADERITPELSEEIKSIVASHKNLIIDFEVKNLSLPTYYRVPRKNIFGRKKWLKHGGWWPDYQIRLFNKKYLKEWPTRIHATPIFEGTCGFFKNPLTHFFHGNLEEMVKKTMIYEEIEAQLLYEARRPVSTITFFRKFFGELFRRLILKLGFLDGKYGVIESIYQAYSKTITYIFLYEKYQKEKSRPL